MRKLLLFAATVFSLTATAQPMATFEPLPLSGTDTFYVNYTNPLTDAGFNDGALHFPYVYDTTYNSWEAGFAYSNKTDSITSGYKNMYAAKAGKGYSGSEKYAVYWAGYGAPKPISLYASSSWFAPRGFYFTNSTFAYNSMRDGDVFAKKFGGTTGNDSDWFKVTVQGYLHGAVKNDSVTFYLADFRFKDNTQDYIVKDWRYVDLTTLGAVDSMFFTFSSSDVGTFGINTPTYFCMDNLSVAIPTAVSRPTLGAALAKVYPNPATDLLHVTLNDPTITVATIYDIAGRQIARQPVTSSNLTFNTAALMAGVYLLKLEGKAGTASVRFVKQ